MSELVKIPKLSVHPGYVVLYNEYSGGHGRYNTDTSKHVLPISVDHKGIISKKASSKIRKGIEWLLVLAQDKKTYSIKKGKDFKFKVAFITLTLSSKQKHSDQVIKSECLNQFLIEAKKKWNVTHYLWRAESQKNGNIHFHILVDKFCPWSELRDTWNRIQNKLGYVDRYRAEMNLYHKSGFQVRKELLKSWSYKAQVRAYRTGSQQDWNSPNSTDVHSVRFIQDLPSYLAKYCTKNERCREITGKLWGLSTSLSQLRGANDVVDNSYTEELICLEQSPGVKTYYSDYFTVIFITADQLKIIGCMLLFLLFKTTVDQYREFYS